MRRRRLADARLFIAALAVLLAIGSLQVTHALAPALTLDPASGFPPSVSGVLSGDGWVCSGGAIPAGPASVTGTDAGGSATINPVGTLTGTFSVRGTAGLTVPITVKASTGCLTIGPPIYLQATATFTFLTPTPVPTPPPTAAPTVPPTAAPTSAPTASPSASPTTQTPTPGTSPTASVAPLASPAPGQNTVVVVGCDPPPTAVSVEFVPLSLMTAAGLDSLAPTGPAVIAPVSRTDIPNTFAFNPPAVEPGRIYDVSAVVTDPDCPPPDISNNATLWLGGSIAPITLPVIPADASKLEAEKSNIWPKGEYKGVWLTDFDFGGKLEGQKRIFRWSTDLANANGAKWQVSLLPFPEGFEPDPLAPPGLLVSGDVTCTDCVFQAPLDKLQPPQKKAGNSWLKDAGNAVLSIPITLGNLAVDAGNAVLNIFGLGSDGGPSDAPAKPITVTPSSGAASNFLATNWKNPVFLPVNYYVRVLPTKDAQIIGEPSNTVVLHYAGEGEGIDVKITNPTPTPMPTKYYDVKIVQYHGIIPPLKPDKVCYVVTQDAWLVAGSFPATYTTKNTGVEPHVTAGATICKPAPKEPDIFEVIADWVVDTVNWVSETYANLKNFVISAIGSFIPDALCDNSCVGFLLDATLASMGIPPDLPNFDQLANMGLDYIAKQAVAQIGLPPEVLDQTGPYAGLALSEAEAKFKSEAEAKLKEGLKSGIASMGTKLSESVSWVPDGIPVRLDEYQQPGAVVKITRPQNAPEPPACAVGVSGYVKFPAGKLENADPEHKSYIDSLPHALSPLTAYDFFANESSQSYGVDANLKIPKLSPGQSVYIPVGFLPNYYTNGWSPNGLVKTSLYINAWWLMHDLGTLYLSASGCGGSDTINVPAKDTANIEAVP